MSKVRIISSIDDANYLRNEIIKSADIAKSNILALASNTTAIDLMYNLKFAEIGFEPLANKPINLMEQLNQMFTYLVSVEGVIFLIKTYPQMAFTLNLGTTSGYDIESTDKSIIAETFSATSPKSNDKLKKDVIRLAANDGALHKYVFYYSANDFTAYVENLKKSYPNVNILKVPFDEYIK